MKKTDASTIEVLREHARLNPEDSYAQIADTFGLSVISVKRYCSDLGRGKDWRRGRKKADADAPRFWAAVDRIGPGDCWLWKGCRNSSGYGFVHFKGKSQGAHRVAYELTHGAIPEGAELDHLCRNRPCCNPAHLEPITHDENMRRVRLAQAKSREGVQSTSPNLIKPDSDTDTAQDMQTDPGFTVVSSSINGNSFKAGNDFHAPRSESTGLVRKGYLDPLRAEFELERSRMSAQELKDEHWGPSNRRKGRSNRGDDFRFFWVEAHGIRTKMIARTAADAEAMFEDIWGPGHDLQSEEDGRPDAAIIEKWFGGWRAHIDRLHKGWMESDLSNRWREMQEQKKKQERQARIAREEEERFNAEFDDDYWRQKRRESLGIGGSYARQ
jgi:hypothetical protein